MRFLIDMNLSPRWVKYLTDAGLDSIHWSSVGKANAPDAEVMGYAVEHDCVLLTHDLDFSAILAFTQETKPSVIQLRTEDVRTEAAGPKVVAAIRHTSSDLRTGAVLSVGSNQTRIRMLPLKKG